VAHAGRFTAWRVAKLSEAVQDHAARSDQTIELLVLQALPDRHDFHLGVDCAIPSRPDSTLVFPPDAVVMENWRCRWSVDNRRIWRARWSRRLPPRDRAPRVTQAPAADHQRQAKRISVALDSNSAAGCARIPIAVLVVHRLWEDRRPGGSDQFFGGAGRRRGALRGGERHGPSGTSAPAGTESPCRGELRASAVSPRRRATACAVFCACPTGRPVPARFAVLSRSALAQPAHSRRGGIPHDDVRRDPSPGLSARGRVVGAV